MSGAKETPRQKMIGMMYLVLTAMLALNVSREILNAFSVVDNSMVATVENIDAKLNQSYSAITSQNAIDPEGANEWYKKSMLAKTYSDTLVDYIEKLKYDLITENDGHNDYFIDEEGEVIPDSVNNMPVSKLKSKDVYSGPTKFFLGIEGIGGNAKEMKKRFAQYTTSMLALVPPKDRAKLDIGLNTEMEYESEHKKGDMVDWDRYFFEGTVLAADVVLMNNFIVTIRNAELNVVNKLASYVGATDFKFTTIEAKVIPARTYIFEGESFSADILVAAYDSTSNPSVLYKMGIDKFTSVNKASAKEIIGEKGKVTLEIPTNGMAIGSHKFAGVIQIKDPTGVLTDYPFESSFDIGKPSATVSADKMNVLYRGLDNPLTISVPGVPSSSVTARATGAKLISKGDGKYVVKPNAGEKTSITVFAEIDGVSTNMGKYDFRNKPVPPPIATVARLQSGSLPRNMIANAGKIETQLKDFLFDGVTCPVVSFTISANVGGYNQDISNNSPLFTAETKQLISKAKLNTRITFDNIIVKYPDGTKGPVSPVSIKAN